ncbi:glycosyltransferase family A protein [Cohnella sp. GbtcB17]|uniref:glycosyltransferase family A protein n=1 Tax=Cohnella sp. GbtcB17 TaxID=2824762 RepID=UPI001C2F8D8C|nr:glycosyltransferase family A protein [Cohnella sp. GbtcB17]
MVNFFYNTQTFFEKTKIETLRKVMYRVLLILIRIIVPLYYILNTSKKSGISNNNNDRVPQVIVSLTSFPPRMKTIWMVLESLLRQTRKPDKIILWLASTQFPSITDVDLRVRRMQKRGLEIRFCEDLKSHKKYFYAMQEFSNDIIITADDDLFYPENMVEELMLKHAEYPESIACYRAHKITFNNGKINKYIDWSYGSKNFSGPDHLLMATNGGGALYPPKSLNQEVFNIEAIKELCPDADDIWLKCMSYLNGTKTVKVHAVFSEMFSTLSSSTSGLAKSNVIEGKNDQQLRDVLARYAINFSDLRN